MKCKILEKWFKGIENKLQRNILKRRDLKEEKNYLKKIKLCRTEEILKFTSTRDAICIKYND